MKTNTAHSPKSRKFTAAALAALLCVGAACAADVTIISDSFTGDDGTAVGRPPDIANLPGGAWAQQRDSANIADNQLALVCGDNAASIALASSDPDHPYVRPAVLTISADLKVDAVTEDGQWPDNPRGMKLGFSSGNPGDWYQFTGLTLHPDGSLDYSQNGKGVVRVAWAGAPFVPGKYYNLSYTIDTVNNKIGNIQLAGSTADYSPLVGAAYGNMTLARTTYAAIRVSCANGNTGYADNFVVSTSAANTPPVVSLWPLNNVKYTPGAHIIASVSLAYGVAPFTVQYYIGPVGGPYSPVGTPSTAPLYQADLGTKPIGYYEVYARVTDNTSPTALTSDSAKSMITVQASSSDLISINYTFASVGPTFSGAACVGAKGDYWNSPSVTVGTQSGGDFGLAPVQLQDSSGAITPVSYSAALPFAQFNYNGNDPNANALYASRIQTPSPASPVTHTITGLAEGYYDVYAYGDWGGGLSVNGGPPRSWTDNGGGALFFTAWGYPQFTLVGGTVYGADAVKFSSTYVASDGTLTINQDAPGGTRLSGFQIVKAVATKHETTHSDKTLVYWTGTGFDTWTAPSDGNVTYLVVGGGGGGGSQFGGGGGGGQVRSATMSVTKGTTYPVVLGDGGPWGVNGDSASRAAYSVVDAAQTCSFGTIEAVGGLIGKSGNDGVTWSEIQDYSQSWRPGGGTSGDGKVGGRGHGDGWANRELDSPPFPNGDPLMDPPASTSGGYLGGGGGGASAVGTAGQMPNDSFSAHAGNGGAGIQLSSLGFPNLGSITAVGGGGGGGTSDGLKGSGIDGGGNGGEGSDGVAGAANTGGGGGGGCNGGKGGAGGSGLVAILFDGPVPVMGVKGGSPAVAIADDNGTPVTPTTADGRDFGDANVGLQMVERTFTIENSGGADLNITAINITGANPGDFTVTQVLTPASPVAPADSATFKVTFAPIANAGNRSATVSIVNNGISSDPWTFAIKGHAISTATVVSRTTSGTWTAPSNGTVMYLIVGGGGGGGSVFGGGGGGGQVVYNTVPYPVTAGTVYPITIGEGGLPGINEDPASRAAYSVPDASQNSSFGPIVALGGLIGKSGNDGVTWDYGNANTEAWRPGGGTSGNGFVGGYGHGDGWPNGATGWPNGPSVLFDPPANTGWGYFGGGGGGASSIGGAARMPYADDPTGHAGNGGAGLQLSDLGFPNVDSITSVGGGGGGGVSGAIGGLGIDGGGNGGENSDGSPGAANTGGGGGGGQNGGSGAAGGSGLVVILFTATNQPVNSPPEITSDGGGATAALSRPENATAVTTVTATDAESDPITFSISGGADADKFSIDPSTGVLTFASAPDYENPTDVGANNTYEVTVQAASTGGTDSQTITVTVTNLSPYQEWLNGTPATDANLKEYAFGTTSAGEIAVIDATHITLGQAPAMRIAGGKVTAVFGRRTDYTGLTYTVEFCDDLGTWYPSTDTEHLRYDGAVTAPAVIAHQGDMDAVSVPFPLFIKRGNQYVKMSKSFMRIGITTN